MTVTLKEDPFTKYISIGKKSVISFYEAEAELSTFNEVLLGPTFGQNIFPLHPGWSVPSLLAPYLNPWEVKVGLTPDSDPIGITQRWQGNQSGNILPGNFLNQSNPPVVDPLNNLYIGTRDGRLFNATTKVRNGALIQFSTASAGSWPTPDGTIPVYGYNAFNPIGANFYEGNKVIFCVTQLAREFDSSTNQPIGPTTQMKSVAVLAEFGDIPQDGQARPIGNGLYSAVLTDVIYILTSDDPPNNLPFGHLGVGFQESDPGYVAPDPKFPEPNQPTLEFPDYRVTANFAVSILQGVFPSYADQQLVDLPNWIDGESCSIDGVPIT